MEVFGIPPILVLALSRCLSLSLSQLQDEEPQDKIPQTVNKVIRRNRLKMVRCPILAPPGRQASSDPQEVSRPGPELSWAKVRVGLWEATES